MAGVIATVVSGTLVVLLVGALRTAQITRALAAEATEAAVIGAYLTRDARALASAASAPGAAEAEANSDSLGVSTADPLGCVGSAPAELVVRLSWPGRAVPLSVVTYSLEPTRGELIRTACDHSGTGVVGSPASVVLGRGFESVTIGCAPVDCSASPELITLSLVAGSGDDPLRYSLSAGLRSSARPAPPVTTEVSVVVLGDGRCPSLELHDGGLVRTAGDIVVDSGCTVPLRDESGQLHVGGSVELADALSDPYEGALIEPASPAETEGTNPSPIGASDTPTSVVVHPLPVTISVDTTFEPGIYVFRQGLTVEAGARVHGEDVLWYVEGGITVDASASIDLDAAEAGPYEGVVVWAATDDPVAIGNDATPSSLGGVVYAPEAPVSVTRRAGICIDAIVAGSLAFDGNGPVHIGDGSDRCDTTASLWTPSSLGSRVMMWVDASDGASVTVNAADAISEWSDRSGGGRSALQDQALEQPTWETGSINGLAAVRFDGVDDSLEFDGSLLAGREYSIAAVARRASARPSNLYLGGAATELGLGWEANDVVGHLHAGSWSSVGVATFAGAAPAQVHLAAATRAQRIVRIDGAEGAVSPGVEPLGSWPGAVVGAGRGSSFDGHVGEVVVVDGALSPSDAARLEAYLAWKWGTAAGLPVGHVHAAAPPLSYAPAAPSAVTAIAGDGEAAIAWSSSTATGRRAPDRFVIEVADDAGFTDPLTVDAERPATEPNVVAATLPDNDVPMWVRVAGANEWGVGPFTATGPFTARDYRSAVLAASPAAYWRLGEPSGEVVYDETDAQAHGRAVDVARSSVGAVASATDTALEIPGPSARLDFDVPTPLSTLAGAVSVSVWFRTSGPGVVLARAGDGVVAPLVYVGGDGALRASFAVASDPTDDEVAVGGPVADGTWHHVVSTSDGSSLRLYLDGALVASGRVRDVPWVATPDLLVAGGVTAGTLWPSTPPSAFVGEVDEVSVHPTALADAEVAALHLSGVTGTNDLVAPSAPESTLRPTPSQVTVTWSTPTASTAVGYRVFRNGVLIRQLVTNAPVVDAAYAADTDSSYAVEAYDSRGNRSPAVPRTARPMVLVVDTTRSTGTTVSLPLRGSVDAVIDWDGACATTPATTTTVIADPARSVDTSCTYAQPGTYTIRVFGSVARYGFGPQSGTPPLMPSQDKITSVGAWGDLGVTSFAGAFVRASNLVSVPADLPATVEDTSHMFQRTASFNQDLGGWDTSNVRTMSYMFQYAAVFNNGCGRGVANCPSIASWDMSNVTKTDRLFESANAFNQNIGAWDMSSVTTLQAMFYAVTGSNPTFNNGCAPGVSTTACASIGSWDTSSVVSLRTTFFSASAFNQDISGWDTSRVTSMYQTFAQASRFDQPIGVWSVGNVQTMWRAFNGAAAFDQDLGDWDTSRVTDMVDMFRNASTFNRDLSGWCVSSITSQPSNFATGATSWLLPKPVWGTCPAP